MICPHCQASITYKERNYNVCSKCNKEYAFEPKTHPLQLNDSYFSKVVAKLSNDGKFYFTKQQLQFVLSRKKIKSSSAVAWLFLPAIITTIVFFIVSVNIIKGIFQDDTTGINLVLLLTGLFFLLWIIFIIFLKLFRRTHISLPQTLSEFHSTVLDRWKSVYTHYPAKLISESSISATFDDDWQGTLICEDGETAMCLSKNHLPEKLELAIISSPKMMAQLPKKLSVLPIYVLHDASSPGYYFFEQIKRQFGSQNQVIDIGLRPQAVMNSKLPQLRKPNRVSGFKGILTNKEISWLKKGYYVPLFVLRPEKLISYVTHQIERRSKAVKTEDPRERAKSIGFMTWAGEK